MTASSEPRAASTLPAELSRRFEAIVCDLGPDDALDRISDGRGLGRLIEAACAAGINLALVSDMTPTDLDGRLGARSTTSAWLRPSPTARMGSSLSTASTR